MTPAWQLFDDQIAIAKENCFTALVRLVDCIGKDLAGRLLQPNYIGVERLRLTMVQLRRVHL